ncbi:MobH family relaxase [Phocoenobacter skyensis]|uniref:MobH family relaxase n=1 Tax=Phocoenobacter skyensis TaxID=97481 RepID=UPI00276A2134|nr:MobH family relaxase [Pasteurella skyensis]MDP8185357.1 MobH family relaxase [Pasteurella skyensis]
MFKKLRQIIKTPQTKPDCQTETQPIKDLDGWITPYNAEILLDTDLRRKYLAMIWQQVSMTREMFDTLYQSPIERYAEMVQLLPASESHHHAHLGGMIDHCLEVISFAIKLRQSYILPPNASSEEQAKQQDAWTACVIYLALVHDIGKVIVDVEIQLKNGSRWIAYNGIPNEPYKFKYIKNRDYELHPVLGGFIANYLIPKEAFDWLAQYPEAFSSLMYAMAGHYDKAGVLSEIIQKADQNSVAIALGGDITKLVQKPVVSFAKQVVTAIRHLVAEKWKFNNPKGPSDGWFTEEGLWIMSKTTADSIRAYLMEQGISVPSDNRRLFDEMQSHNIVESTPDDTAIWHCKITAESGWKPKNSFSLLKLKPEIAWENIDDRPAFFAGNIIVEETTTKDDSETNVISNESTEDDKPEAVLQEAKITETITENHKIVEPETALVTEEIQEPDNGNNAMNFVLNMFNTSDSTTENDTQESEIIPEFENITKHSEKVTEPTAEEPKKVEISDSQNTQFQNADPLGIEFFNWIYSGLKSKKITYNHAGAKVHIVNDSVFLVTPNIFKEFLVLKGIQTDEENLNKIQYAFQSLGINKKRFTKNDSSNFWTCIVKGRKRTSKMTGFLIPEKSLFFNNKVVLNNRFLTLNKEQQNE